MDIRKISVGSDYKNAMNYIKGQTILNGTHTVCNIIQINNGSIQVWIMNESKEIMLWKAFVPSMPCSIEYNIDF